MEARKKAVASIFARRDRKGWKMWGNQSLLRTDLEYLHFASLTWFTACDCADSWLWDAIKQRYTQIISVIYNLNIKIYLVKILSI